MTGRTAETEIETEPEHAHERATRQVDIICAALKRRLQLRYIASRVIPPLRPIPL